MALTTDLTAYWSFNNDYTDVVNGYNGTGNNSPSFEMGKYHEGVGLDASNSQYISINSFEIDEKYGMTFSFWVLPYFSDTFSTSYSIMRFKDDGDNNIGLKFDKDGYLEAQTANSNPACQTSLSNIQNTWMHIALCFDGGGNLEMYLDGSQVGSDSYSDQTMGTATLYLGSDDGPSTFFDGIIDEVGFWHARCFSSSEVTDLYNNGDGKFYNASLGGFVTPTFSKTRTDNNGNYSFSSLDDSRYYHITVQYWDSSGKYNSKSYPLVSSSGGTISGKVTNSGTAVPSAKVYCIGE